MFFGRRFAGYHKGELSGLDILVLSIINNKEKGISGYEIIQELENKYRGMWKTSAGTIYPLLNRLTVKEFVNIKAVIDNNRDKKLYSITEKGIEELKNALSHVNSSFYSMIDFIKTISKSFPMFSCFPFPDKPEHCAFISEYNEEEENYGDIKSKVERLENAKKRLESKVSEIDRKLQFYHKILEKMKSEAKTIEIVDDDDEFERF
jgi:DNA-binding PadR family transcriptional regulator